MIMVLKKRLVCLTLIGAIEILILSPNVLGDQQSLRGIKVMGVVVYVQPKVEGYGLSEENLKTDVELKLRRIGIKALELQEMLVPAHIPLETELELARLEAKNTKRPFEEVKKGMARILEVADSLDAVDAERAGSPYLCVNVNTLTARPGDEPHVIYEVCIEFKQGVRLERDTSIFEYGATTWDKGVFGVAPADRVEAVIRGVVSDLVDQFINAYLAENRR